ncbi:MAG: nucleotidyl transferase AbiEii/AbiGii toxin family protein [Legionellales bacterium]|nr:nucleotidyl transferase AbiEii/AbiGii toxin family protein [Legionellales bacterium]
MSIPYDPINLHRLIVETADILNLDSLSVVEKDFHVTQAIHVLSEIKNDDFSLIFQGGTSLAKAHRIIERMSEDCDFRIHVKESWIHLNPSQKRNRLRDFRYEMIAYLKKFDFLIAEDSIKVRDAGNYFQFNLLYSSLYDKSNVLRPHIQLEFMAVTSKLPTQLIPITTLIKQVLGENVDHPEKSIGCVSISETTAEKWVALTRRVSNATRNPAAFLDPTLVRHIYDLYCIGEKKKINEEVFPLINSLIKEDITRYKNQNTDYAKNPIAEIKSALLMLSESKEWEKNWDIFTQEMVYGENRPNYQTALHHLNRLSEHIFSSLKLNYEPKSGYFKPISEMRSHHQAWFQASLPSEIESLRNSENDTLKKIGGYLTVLTNQQNNSPQKEAQSRELLELLTKSALRDPTQSPLLRSVAPVFSQAAQAFFEKKKIHSQGLVR